MVMLTNEGLSTRIFSEIVVRRQFHFIILVCRYHQSNNIRVFFLYESVARSAAESGAHKRAAEHAAFRLHILVRIAHSSRLRHIRSKDSFLASLRPHER